MAMKLLTRGADTRLPPVETARLMNAGTRLMQVFQEGLLALKKNRTGGRQQIVVQHIQVAEGGQAVIAGQVKAGHRGPTPGRPGCSRTNTSPGMGRSWKHGPA